MTTNKTNSEPMTTATLELIIRYLQRTATAQMHRRWAEADIEYLLTGNKPMRRLYMTIGAAETHCYIELNDPGC